MESTIRQQQIEKLQEYKEQMIQRSRQAESNGEGHHFLCLADLYSLAIQHENAKMYGSTLTINVGNDDDAVTKVSIEVRPDFKANTNYFEVSFAQWQAVPNKMVRKVRECRFTSAEEAFESITSLSENINRFFNTIKL